jgi:HSP20 family protein
MAANRSSSTAVTQRPEEGYVPLRQVMDRLFSESFLFPSLFNDMGSYGWRPTAMAGTNLWETNDSYVLQIAMPGMNADSISCTVEQNTLTCKAESALQAPPNAAPVWQTLGGQASYRIQLPAEVEAGQAQASYTDGILTITLPKAAHARTQSIKVVAK